MAEVEDVARAPRGAQQHSARLTFDDLPGSQQNSGLEVTLDALVESDAAPCFVEREAPIHTDHVAAGGCHLLQQVRRTGAEVDGGNRIVNDRDAVRRWLYRDGADTARAVRLHVFQVLFPAQRPRPGVAELDH